MKRPTKQRVDRLWTRLANMRCLGGGTLDGTRIAGAHCAEHPEPVLPLGV